MNTHGDYSIQQLIYNEGKLATVIDFETAKKMPIVWEIVRSYSYVDKNAEDGKQIQIILFNILKKSLNMQN